MTKINYFKAWIVFFLIATLGGAVVGYLVGTILFTLGVDVETQASVFKLFGFIAGVIVSFLGFRFSVKTFIVQAMAENGERRTLNAEH